MKKSNIVKPTSLKGNDKLDRIRQLMPKVPVNEGITRSVVELTKMGPDGNVYAIVRENHEYYIKISDNKDSLLSEDFNYIGGLQNKKDKAYSSYAKAIKQLNLKFMSINEAIGKSGNFNVFESDDLVSEHHPLKADMKLSDKKGIGNGQEYVVNSKGAELKYDNKEGKEEDGFGDNVADSKAEKDVEKVKLSENETAIDEMIEGKDKECKCGGDCRCDEGVVKENTPIKKGFSIAKAIQEMDSVIDSIATEDDKVNDILESLGESEKAIMMEALKKNVNEIYEGESRSSEDINIGDTVFRFRLKNDVGSSDYIFVIADNKDEALSKVVDLGLSIKELKSYTIHSVETEEDLEDIRSDIAGSSDNVEPMNDPAEQGYEVYEESKIKKKD